MFPSVRSKVIQMGWIASVAGDWRQYRAKASDGGVVYAASISNARLRVRRYERLASGGMYQLRVPTDIL